MVLDFSLTWEVNEALLLLFLSDEVPSPPGSVLDNMDKRSLALCIDICMYVYENIYACMSTCVYVHVSMMIPWSFRWSIIVSLIRFEFFLFHFIAGNLFFMCVRMYVCTYVCTYVCMYVCMSTYKHEHTSMYI